MSPKEIAEYILKDGIITTNAEDVYSLARAYLELLSENEFTEKVYRMNRKYVEDKKAENTKLKEEIKELSEYKQMYQSIAGKANLKHLVESEKALQSENEKLKKSREVLRSAFEVIARGESQFDNVDHMYTAREALKADSEIMEGE